jgi:hypothetical protein
LSTVGKINAVLEGKVSNLGARTYQRCSVMARHRHSPVSGFRTTICKRSSGGWSGKTVKTLPACSSSSLDSLADATRLCRVCFGFAMIKFPSLGCKDDGKPYYPRSRLFDGTPSRVLACGHRHQLMNYIPASLVFSPSHAGLRRVRCGQGKSCSACCGVRGKGVGILGCEV